MKSAVAFGLSAYAHKRGIWDRCVSKFIAMTAHGRSIFMKAGLAEEKIAIKPNLTHNNKSGDTYAIITDREFLGGMIDGMKACRRRPGVDEILVPASRKAAKPSTTAGTASPSATPPSKS